MKLFEVYTAKMDKPHKIYRFWRFAYSPHHDTCTNYFLTRKLWFNRIAPHFYFITKGDL